MKRILVIILMVLWCRAYGQQLGVTKPFEEMQLSNQEEGKIEWQRDASGSICAQLRILTSLKNLQIEGEGLVLPERKEDGYYLWLRKGTRELVVRNGDAKELQLKLGNVKSGRVYSMGVEILRKMSVSETVTLDAEDASASQFSVTDPASGEACALVQLGLMLDSVEFEGAVDSVSRRQGSYWIWLAPGSKTMTIRAPGYEPLEMKFDAVEKVGTYRATVSLPQTMQTGSTIDQEAIDAIHQPAEEAYALWKRSTGKTAVTRGEEFVRQYPNSDHSGEVKSSLYRYYFKLGNYRLAKRYAHTDAERKEIGEAVEAQKRKEKKEERERAQWQASMRRTEMFESVKWKPWSTVGLEGGLPYTVDYFIDFYPFAYTSELNMCIRAHAGSIQSSMFSDGDNGDRFEYYRVSPQLSLMWGGEAFYIALGGMINFNSGYTYRYLVSGDTVRYKATGLLNKMNWSLRAEVMWHIEDVATLYVYYNYDITPTFNATKIAQLQADATDPHYTSLNTNPWLDNQMNRRGLLGIGVSLNLLKCVKIN